MGMLLLTDIAPPPGPFIITCKRAFEHLTGYVRAELIGRSPRLLQGPRTEARLVSRLRLALAAGKAERVVVINYRRGGDSYLCDILIRPIGQDLSTGRPTHFLALEREVRRRRGHPLAGGSGRYVPVDPALAALALELFD